MDWGTKLPRLSETLIRGVGFVAIADDNIPLLLAGKTVPEVAGTEFADWRAWRWRYLAPTFPLVVQEPQGWTKQVGVAVEFSNHVLVLRPLDWTPHMGTINSS